MPLEIIKMPALPDLGATSALAHSCSGASNMPLPLRFPGSTKKEEVSYAAVEVGPSRSDTNVTDLQPKVAGWPTAPRRILNAPIWIIGDFLLLLLPIAFIGEVRFSDS